MSKGKYYKLILSLEDHELYSTFAIADLAVDFYKIRRHGYARKLIRKAMYSRTKSHQFPVSGDRALKSIGHAEVPAWYGWRWKKSLEDPQPQTIRRGEEGSSGFRFWRALVLSVSALTLVGFLSAAGSSRLREGYRILWNQGASAAYQFFVNHESLATLIGKGWSALEDGRPDEACQIAERLIAGGRAGKKADGYYLLGYGKLYLLEFDKAESAFLTAAKLYRESRYFDDESLTYIGLANLCFQRYAPNNKTVSSELIKAEEYLNKAALRTIPNPNLYFAIAQLEFEKGNYNKALQNSRIGLSISKSNSTYQIIGSIMSGLNGIVLGNLDEAEIQIQNADTIIAQVGDPYNYWFNLCNHYLIEKCRGRDNQIMLQSIQDYNNQANRPFLSRIITFVETFSCPASQKAS